MNQATTLVIPTLPERAELLKRALRSASFQELDYDAIVIQPAGPTDDAAHTRQNGLNQVKTPWVTFLDDDDELEPEHLLSLRTTQAEFGSDIVYSWFTVYENDQPVPDDSRQLWLNGKSAFGRPWSREHYDALQAGTWCFHLTALFRTEMLQDVGGFEAPGRGKHDTYLSEDLNIEQRLARGGATVTHCPRRTWRWHFWIGRTKGQPAP